MKVNVTKKAILNEYSKNRIISLGYCVFENFFKFLQANFYTSGVYGWNADIYDFGNFCIVTGYRPFGSDNKEIEDIIKKYDAKLSKINFDSDEIDKIYKEFKRETLKALSK